MRQTAFRRAASASSPRLLHISRPSKKICASLSCAKCRHVITPSADNMCLFHQVGDMGSSSPVRGRDMHGLTANLRV